MIITLGIARAALEKVVAEKGENYVYPRYLNNMQCVYAEVVGGEVVPSCIVGYAINEISHELFEKLAEEEIESGGMEANDIRWVQIEEEARDALRAAQAKQDAGKTWGEALYAFDNFGHENA